jgi:hypothetical protein
MASKLDSIIADKYAVQNGSGPFLPESFIQVLPIELLVLLVALYQGLFEGFAQPVVVGLLLET